MAIKYTSKYESPWASPATLHTINTGDWRHQRPVTKQSKCGHCATCYIFCPTGCITDKGGYYGADLSTCKGCGICAHECPTKAITIIREVRED